MDIFEETLARGEKGEKDASHIALHRGHLKQARTTLPIDVF